MFITKHAIKRFRERVTEGPVEFIKNFIKEEIAQSILLYSFNGTEKRYSNGLVFVVENKKVVTLYPKVIE